MHSLPLAVWDQRVTSCQAAVRHSQSTDSLSDWPSHFCCQHVNETPQTHIKPKDWICSALNLDLMNTQFAEDWAWVNSSSNVTLRKRETTVPAISQDSGSKKAWMRWSAWRFPEASQPLTWGKSYFPSFTPYQTFLPTRFVRTAANMDISVTLKMIKTHPLAIWSFGQTHCEKTAVVI